MQVTAHEEEWGTLLEVRPRIRDYWRELAARSIRTTSYAPNYFNDAGERAEIVGLFDTPINGLGEWYDFRDYAAVRGYLRDHPSLCDVLEEAREKIARFFGPDVDLILDLVTGFEADDDKRLFVFVQTDLAVNEALDRLDALYEQWWIDALSRVSPKLSIDVEYL